MTTNEDYHWVNPDKLSKTIPKKEPDDKGMYSPKELAKHFSKYCLNADQMEYMMVHKLLMPNKKG